MVQIYAALDIENFNRYYVLMALKVFIYEIENKYRKIGKMKVSKVIMDSINIVLKLDKSFILESFSSRRLIYLPFIEFITGTDLGWDFERFDYSIYQKELFEKSYSKKENCYILEIKEMMKEKVLKEMLDNIGIFNYFYDIYQECKKTISLLEENIYLNPYHIAERKIKFKYLV